MGQFLPSRETIRRHVLSVHIHSAVIAAKIAANNMAAEGMTIEKPEDRPSASMQQDATESMARKLARQSGAERAGTAADNFWGFYLINTRARPDYCAAKGVDSMR